jgi:hypothetical protein
MAELDRTVMGPSPAEWGKLLHQAASAANHRCRNALALQDWPTVVAELSGREGMRAWRGGKGKTPWSEVACAWWTDHLGHRHVRAAGRRRDPKAPLHAFFDRIGARPPLLLTSPDRTFRRTAGERIAVRAVCGCGEVGTPAALAWTGDCCGPCHDRRQEGRGPPEAPAALDPGGDVKHVAVAADGRTVAALTADGLRVWSAIDGALRLAPQALSRQRFGRGVALSPDGKRVAVGFGSDRVREHQVEGGRLIAEHPSGLLFALAYAPDGRRLAHLSGQALSIWDGDTVERLSGGWYPWRGALAVSPDGQRVAAGRFNHVELHRGTERATLEIGLGHVWSLAFSPDGARLAVGRGEGRFTHDTDGRVLIADVATRGWVSDLPGHADAPGRPRGAVFVGWLPDGRLVSVGSDGTVRVWGADGEPVTLEGPAGACTSAALSADGELLVTNGRGGDVLLWPLRRLLEA